MFIVSWEGRPPPDKAEWIDALRDALAGELGSYRIVFSRAPGGWRFALEWREGEEEQGEEVVANTPESVAYNLYVNLAGAGKPLDASWRPWDATDGSSLRDAPPSRPASGTRTTRGR